MRDPSSNSDEESSVFACCKEMLKVKCMHVGIDKLRKRNKMRPQTLFPVD